jgi:hypothetical protein
MGIDLSIFPLTRRKSIDEESFYVAHLKMDGSLCDNRELFDDFQKLDSVPIKAMYMSGIGHEEDGPIVTEDAYGNPLRSVMAVSLKKFKDDPRVQKVWQNETVWAFIDKLPDDHPVVLYWD